MSDIFEQLESNDKNTVESVKQSIRDQFSKVQERWLLDGLYDHYLRTNSIRVMDILVTLKEPHHTFLFDKIVDSIRSPKNENKVQALTLFGHVVRSQPTWLYKLPDHILLREMLKLLKNEVELLPLISALLVLIVLLPMIPSSMGEYLTEIFDIFSRLASWNCSPGQFVEDQMIHMQVALYALFNRLYGMYPCNFLAYLRGKYRDKNNPVFFHTIKPMLDTVKMHPSLVTASKDNETTTERWKKMGVHDVIVECERFSLDLVDRCPHDNCQYTSGFRSRSGTANSGIFKEQSHQIKSLKGLPPAQITGMDSSVFFTPSSIFNVHTPPITEPAMIPEPHIQDVVESSDFELPEGSSPPEAAIEATPETTPVRDYHRTASLTRNSPSTATASRTMLSFGGPKFAKGAAATAPGTKMTGATSPLHQGGKAGSQSASSHQQQSRASGTSTSVTPAHSQPSSPMRGAKEFGVAAPLSPFSFAPSPSAFVAATRAQNTANQKLMRLNRERAQAAESAPEHVAKSKPTPSSPLRIINPEFSRQPNHRNESPVSLEDEEVVSIVNKSPVSKQPLRPCDSVLTEFENNADNIEDQEHGSPCTAGGLHMPNSKSMNNFKKRVKRLRYHSQCEQETDLVKTSTGSSPGNSLPFPNSTTVQRANSCPEIEKERNCFIHEKRKPPFYESEEETASENQPNSLSNTSNGIDVSGFVAKPGREVASVSTCTQTANFWPMPYEHLFLGIFPSLEGNEVKPSPAPSPAPLNLSQERYQLSVYDILDKYIDSAVFSHDGGNLQSNLQLLHQQLLFERHRRETHAYRNRSLLSDAKSTRLLEECNSALRDQVQLQQKDIEDLQKQLENCRRERLAEDSKMNRTIQHWEEQCKKYQQECEKHRERIQELQRAVEEKEILCKALDKERQAAEAALLDAIAEANIAKEQALVGEKGKAKLCDLTKQLLLIGEIQLEYKERLDKLSANRQLEDELIAAKEAYRNELRLLHQQLEGKAAAVEAFRARVVDLEHAILAKEDVLASQKRMLKGMNEERHEKIEAVESKYQTQLRINQAYEEKILELHHLLDAATHKAAAAVSSPDTSSCQEAAASAGGGGMAAGGVMAGYSAHSSPLSASLASSCDGALPQPEVKNIQAIVDQSDGIGPSRKLRRENSGESSSNIYTEKAGQPSSS